jgi:hypothetical protein
MTCGFGKISSAWQDLTMSSACCNTLQCSRDLRKAMLQSTTIRSMATHTPKGTYLADGIYSKIVNICEDNPPTFIHQGSWFAKCLEGCRKDVERILVCRRLVLLLSRYPSITWSTDQMWKAMRCSSDWWSPMTGRAWSLGAGRVCCFSFL